ncbi:MAG TPA: lytic transglycosylase domain-containing protein [Terriglobia bacterium]|nr:lytic transglycosylase domain-containing protein [Terriglobia bacterium]
MQSRMFHCRRCGVLKLGWTRRYMAHGLLCRRWLHKSGLGGAALCAALIISFPKASESIPPEPPSEGVLLGPPAPDPVQARDAQIHAVEALLKHHKVGENKRERLAESIVASAKKYELSPRLLASIVIVESRGNPFAISGKDAVGVMQIHLPTWGETAERENVNLFKIEDNVDFGARILQDYVRRFGMAGGVKRYNGFIPGEPTLEESSERYLSRVREVFDFGDSSNS